MVGGQESDDRAEMDRFIGAMRDVLATPDVERAPVRVPRERVDETKAARELRLRHPLGKPRA